MSDKSAPKPLNLREYHRPKRIKLTDARIPTLSAESKRCLRNLAAYRPRKPKFPFPRERSAAVLVALFVGRLGDLYVLLSRRSSTLRSYAGDTSLPGGKVDPEDRTIEDTARREAFEEIGLPRNKLQVPLLCVLEPFLSSNHLIVTPRVRLLVHFARLRIESDTGFGTPQPILNASEVASLFSHPLTSFLSSSPPFPTEPELIEVPYHTTSDHTYLGPNDEIFPTRAHRFLTGREAGGIKPVFGLTACVFLPSLFHLPIPSLNSFMSLAAYTSSAILIKAASVAHAPRVPDFEVMPPGAQTPEARIAWSVYSSPTFREAYAREGIRVDWNAVARIAGVKDMRLAGIRDEKDKAVRESSARHRRRAHRSKL
ncbi:Nudix hydrolase 15, mitochondrial [Mycena sanguinolenta]|uniref:Nudix hydrolase 15, mitochondrial n=1 Tax=Mycena sanguinolenta TaxID=230812 RepID=A0A8H6YNA7_9AGAR|nr:Nudix hydrolase 15, mitochondrial [Mycena sanguinolenta]